MKNKLLFGIISVIALIVLASAAIYTEPWNQNQRGGNYNLTGMDYITSNYFVGSFVGDLDSMNWTKLKNYPVACPGSGAVTTLGDSVTCSDLWVDVAGDTMTGNLNITGNITANNYYGEMWVQNVTGYVTTTISSSNVWYNLTGFNNTEMVIGQSLNGFTYNNYNEHLTVLIAGKYKVMYSVSTGNAGNNQEYEFAVAINNIIQNNTVTHRKIQTAGDVGNTAGSGFINLLVNDSVYPMVSNKDGTADIQVHAMNINLIRIGN